MSAVQRLGPEGFVEFPPAAPITSRQICDMITTIVAAILLTTAISLTIYYAVHPTVPMIPITADCSISLPLLICSVMGVALAMVLVVQVARCQQVKLAFRKGVVETVQAAPFAKKQVTKGFYIQSRPPEQTCAQYQVVEQEKIDKMETDFGIRVQMPTRDGIILNGYYYESNRRCLAIYFPTTFNLTEDHENDYWGYVYKKLGFSVLVAGYRGYGMSEGSAGGKHQEIEAYLDAEAAWVWAREQEEYANADIIVHGREHGCVYAAALGYFCNVPQVVFENPYTSYAAFTARFTSMDPSTTHQVICTSFAQGTLDQHPRFPAMRPLATDGFDILKKVCLMAGDVFVFQTTDDWIMSSAGGQEIMQAKYPNSQENQKKYLSIVSGGRNSTLFFTEPEPCFQLLTFLYERGVYGSLPFIGRSFCDLTISERAEWLSSSVSYTESDQSDEGSN